MATVMLARTSGNPDYFTKPN